MEILLAKKVDLLRWLRGDSIILEHVQAQSLITRDDYETVDSTQNPSDKAKRLLNIIIYKGDETCINFLKLLKNEEVNEFCPELRNWIATVNLPSGKKLTTPQAAEQSVTGKSSGTDMCSDTSQAAMQKGPDYLAFLKKNRSKLIDMVTNVDKILDDIELQEEMMSKIQAESTTQAKTRKIIDVTKSKKAAERLYNALNKHESDIMEEME